MSTEIVTKTNPETMSKEDLVILINNKCEEYKKMIGV
jgi:hypothetical protein